MGLKVYGKDFRTVSIILQREEKYTNNDEAIAFATNIGEKKMEQDVLTRYKRAMRDIFTFDGKKQYKDFSEIKDLIKNNGNESDVIRIFNRIAQEFQHSDYYDYVSNNVRANVLGKYWIIVNTKKKEIQILDCGNQFKNLLEEEGKSKELSNKAITKEVLNREMSSVLARLGRKFDEYGNRYGLVDKKVGKPFKYGNDIFMPVARSTDRYKTKVYDKCINKEGRYENYEKHNWNYDDFIKADEKVNVGSLADIYYCFNNGKFYMPAKNELFEYKDKEFSK